MQQTPYAQHTTPYAQHMPVAPHTPLIPHADRTTVGGLGESVRRPDGIPKVKGEFAYSSDMHADGMLWGATLRSPHPSATITSLDISAVETMDGVRAVLTHSDVPGAACYGLDITDQPVLAIDTIRYQGEPIAIVAADSPEAARRALDAIRVTFDVHQPVVDPEFAITDAARRLHPDGNVTRTVSIRHGNPDITADVVVSGVYNVGMQDQAFLGPEAGMAVPDGEGGVDLYISTQWLHVDQEQLASVLGLPESKVRLTLAGVGGAFGAREDLSLQAHCCMLALATERPVKMMYSREESFFGHVHRHPAKMYYEHGADRDGNLVYVRCNLILDGGAYASSSTAVAANAACFSCGPYEVPNANIDATVAYTNNPPCGAMRGFGAVQACFGYESQMDLLAAKLGMDPLDFRIKNAMVEGTRIPTGQAVEGPVPVRELLEAVRDMPLPTNRNMSDSEENYDLRQLPGGVSNTTHGEGVQRGVGYGVGYKNVCYAEGFDDFSTARVLLELDPEGHPVAYVHTAAAEVGQGLVTILGQIARSELGIEQAIILPSDTNVGSAGSTSASRQTYMTGGAAQAACHDIHAELLARAQPLSPGFDTITGEFVDGTVRDAQGNSILLVDLLQEGPIERTHEFHHRTTHPLDPVTGQGDAHVQFAFAAHRATVDVDVDLGLVKLVEIATAQDVGRALNPQAVVGQLEGGTAQGIGLALMEEIQVVNGEVKNPSFTDYLIPTILDMPPMQCKVFELADPEAPYGIKGVGEPPTISSTPAVVSAIRAASGAACTRIPVSPDDIVS